MIWVGTDDGKVQVTKNAGTNWTDVTKEIAKAGGPEDAWVTRVFASNFSAGTAYVAKSRLRQDDFRPFLFKTSDFGVTWTSISSNLPTRTINVIVEDYKNPDLLFIGNDTGVFVSLDSGKHWTPLKGNMPNVPVHDLLIHPREADLIAGTFGRGIWITNIAALRELSDAVLGEDVHFFAVQSKTKRTEGAQGNYRLLGDRHVVTPNDLNGLTFVYYLKDQAKEKVTITIADPAGATVRTLEGTAKAGLNRVVSSFQPGGPFGNRNDANQREILPGDYIVTLQVGEKKYTQTARVLP